MAKQEHDYTSLLQHTLKLTNRFSCFSKEFLTQRDAAGKIRLATEVAKEMHFLPPISLLKSNFAPKNDTASLAARNKGNNFFIKQKNYVPALESYNRSISLATGDSENLAIGFANRSAVYLNSGCYKYCLQNIDLALKNNYPEKLRPKLEQRKRECLEFMNNREDSLEKFEKEKKLIKLSYPANEKIPFIVNGLEYAKSEEFGRHIRAKQDLYPGDIIIIEEPFIKCVLAETRLCANCFASNYLNLLPCAHCSVLFCSDRCRDEAWTRFHQYECPIIDKIFSLFNPTMIGAIRAVLRSFTMFSNPEDLEKLIKKINVETENAFTLDHSCLTEEKHFRAIYGLATNDSSIDFDAHTNSCAAAWYILSKYSDLSPILKTKSLEDTFLNLLYRFLRIFVINSHGMGHPFVESDADGIGLYSLCSLLNHSCVPNIERIFVGTKCVVFVKQVIKAGEQLFDHYGPTHLMANLGERQKNLKFQYKIDCKCKACVYNFPLYEDLPVSEKLQLKLYDDKQRIRKYDFAFTHKKFKEYKKSLKEKNHKNYPSFEICATEYNLIECVISLMFGMPLEQQLKPLEQ